MAAEGATFTPPSLPPVRVALPLPTAPSQRPPQDLPVGSPRSPEMRAPEFRVEMPVLKRRAETPSPAAPFGALVTAGAPGARVQRSQEGGSRSAAASVSSRSEVKTGEDHGTRVHLLAREVYGILRRRIRDEMERSRPYGRF